MEGNPLQSANKKLSRNKGIQLIDDYKIYGSRRNLKFNFKCQSKKSSSFAGH